MKKLMISLILFAMVPVAANAAEILKRVPDRLSSEKSYVLVELVHADVIGSAVPANLTLARYDAVKGDIRGGLRSPDSALPAKAPVRIFIANKPLQKERNSRLYLIELEPDIWVVEGSGGTAFSLGSYAFTLNPGEVVDLGVISPHPDWREGDGPAKEMKRVLGSALLFGALVKTGDPTPWMADHRQRGAGDIPVPSVLAGMVVSARLDPGAKFGNYLGGLVNRIDGRAGRDVGVTSAAAEVR